MAKYWATFRIEDKTSLFRGTYSARYEALMANMREIRDGSWAEPTSFFLFTTSYGIDAVIKHLSSALDSSLDLLVVGDATKDELRYFGALEHKNVLLALAPFTAKAA